jgi:hypothetical protein
VRRPARAARDGRRRSITWCRTASIHGYGLSPEIVGWPRKREADILITVDNGIASVDGVAAAQAPASPR